MKKTARACQARHSETGSRSRGSGSDEELEARFAILIGDGDVCRYKGEACIKWRVASGECQDNVLLDRSHHFAKVGMLDLGGSLRDLIVQDGSDRT